MFKLALGLSLALVVYGGIQYFSSSTTVYVQDVATSTPLLIEEEKENPFEVAKREAINAEWATREGEAKEKAQKEYDRMMDEQRVASDKAALEALRKSLLPEIEALEKKQGF